ncbi:carboxy terminal-processing peptidase [Pedobacter sp. AW31-3R]|uniref:carboxy terminal-processing peptidase n=1 Tax=Pedobacter sp. AW31-3R TaxID=3445781 RepID=UPI003F9F6DA0
MFKKISSLLSLTAVLACTVPVALAAKSDPQDLKPDENQNKVSRIVVKMITESNYKKIELNDSISILIFDRYLKTIDGTRSYLMAADIEGFNAFKTRLDDDLKAGELNDAFYMFNTYQKRYRERWEYALSLLKTNIDLVKKESYTYNRKDLPFVKTDAEMNAIWAKRVKYDLLNLKLASADMAKNKETLKKRYQNFLDQSAKLTNQDVFQVFMNAFTGSVDPHTNYFTPAKTADYEIQMARSLEGIGATLASENEYVTIKTITTGGPAYKTRRFNTDDRIIAVAQGRDGEFQDIVGWRLDNAIALIRGAKGSLVRLKILPKGKSISDAPIIIDVVRAKIILEEMSAKKEVKTYTSNGRTVKIGVINIPSFYIDVADYQSGNPNYKSTTRDVKLILDTLKAMKVDGVVIDLRENGGGSLQEAISLTGLFIKNGPVVQVRDTRGEIRVEKDEDPSVAYAGPMAVLVDRFSASASEIFSGAIQDYGRGVILGTQTYGKGTVQTPVGLDRMLNKGNNDASAGVLGQLNLTIGKFYRINGSSTQHMGVSPDIVLPSLIPISKYGEDTEPAALPWDTIGRSNYVPIGSFAEAIPLLSQLHKERAKNNSAYGYFSAFEAELNRNEALTTLVLGEQELKKQRESDELKTLQRDNLLRKAMGLPALKKGQLKGKTDELDFAKKEAGQILADYILMTNIIK